MPEQPFTILQNISAFFQTIFIRLIIFYFLDKLVKFSWFLHQGLIRASQLLLYEHMKTILLITRLLYLSQISISIRMIGRDLIKIDGEMLANLLNLILLITGRTLIHDPKMFLMLWMCTLIDIYIQILMVNYEMPCIFGEGLFILLVVIEQVVFEIYPIVSSLHSNRQMIQWLKLISYYYAIYSEHTIKQQLPRGQYLKA